MLILGAPKVQIFKDGQFLVGGKIYTYDAGTTTPRATYPTWDDATNETNANSNPVILDARGEADIVLKGPTKVVVADENDVELWSIDDLDESSIDITGIDGGSLLTFTGVADAVNHFQISNSSQGNEVILEVVGDDTNIGLEIKCKGNEDFQIINSNLEITVGNLILTSGDINVTSGDINALNGALDIDEGILNIASGSITLMPAGMMMWYGGSTPPDGWLECNGAAISRTTYGNLFNKIGTAFGIGDGSTTFNLPNQARNTLVGKGGTPSGTLGSSIGSTGGSETHTLSIAEMAAHTHTRYIQPKSSSTNFSAGSTFPDLNGAPTLGGFTTSSTGGGGVHNIVQPSLVSMLIIRAK